MFGKSKKRGEQDFVGELQKFKLATENASDHIIITDYDGIIIFANKSVERITGFKPEEILGKKAGSKDLWGGLMDEEFYKKLWNTIKIEKKVFTGEITNKRKSGEKYEALSSISPVLDENDCILYYVGIERDITKEKNIDKAKTEFVSLVSHQLRTPLTSINWYLEILLSGGAGEINHKQREYLEKVLESSKRMVTLVNVFLNVSRLDLGAFVIESEPIDLVKLAKDIIEELKPQIIKKGIAIEEFYGDNLSKFNADRKLLTIILQNLLSNAVKYTPNNGDVRLEIFSSKDILTIKVSDSGIGIPEEQKEKIFSKMFRADNAKESETDGSGLGLYLTKNIVEQGGGKIWFDSEKGENTIFYVTFPLTGLKSE